MRMRVNTHKAKVANTEWQELIERYQKQKKRIAAHVKADPRAAMTEAHQAIDYGVEMLLKIVESKAFFYKANYTDATDDRFHDDAISCLCTRANWISEKVAVFARAGEPSALICAWCGGQLFAEVIHHVALSKPESLKLLASDALFLPSLRAKSKTFTHDFEAVSKAIGLSQASIVNMDSSAMHQLDKPATRLVAEILEEIASWQRRIKWDEGSLQQMQELAKEHPGSEWEKYRNVTLEDWIRDHYPHNPEVFVYRQLPPFNKNTVSDWWGKAVKPYLIKASTLTKIKGTPFYESLRKATANGKDYEIKHTRLIRGKVWC